MNKLNRENFLRSNPNIVFFNFWEAECEHKPTREQLKILYKKRFDWFNQTLSVVISQGNKKLYALNAVELALPMFEKVYQEDSRPHELIEAIKNNNVSKQVIDNIEQCLDECGSDNYYSQEGKYRKAFSAANSIFLLADSPSDPSSIMYWTVDADKGIKEKSYEFGMNLLIVKDRGIDLIRF